MTKAMKARHGGFTLVELLIVIIIIAILAGMLLLATGSATDNAEATKIINDLRNLKAASMMYYVDNDSWPNNAATDGPSLDLYLDRPFFTAAGDNAYQLLIETGVPVTITGGGTQDRDLIGFTTPVAKPVTLGVAERLQSKSANSGVVDEAGAAWAITGTNTGTVPGEINVYMFMR